MQFYVILGIAPRKSVGVYGLMLSWHEVWQTTSLLISQVLRYSNCYMQPRCSHCKPQPPLFTMPQFTMPPNVTVLSDALSAPSKMPTCLQAAYKTVNSIRQQLCMSGRYSVMVHICCCLHCTGAAVMVKCQKNGKKKHIVCHFKTNRRKSPKVQL